MANSIDLLFTDSDQIDVNSTKELEQFYTNFLEVLDQQQKAALAKAKEQDSKLGDKNLTLLQKIINKHYPELNWIPIVYICQKEYYFEKNSLELKEKKSDNTFYDACYLKLTEELYFKIIPLSTVEAAANTVGNPTTTSGLMLQITSYIAGEWRKLGIDDDTVALPLPRKDSPAVILVWFGELLAKANQAISQQRISNPDTKLKETIYYDYTHKKQCTKV